MCLGIPGEVLEVTGVAAHTAAVRVSGARRVVDVSMVEDEGIAPGEWVLVHAGLALAKISEQEALETLALQQELSDAFMGNVAEHGASSYTSESSPPRPVE